MNCGETAEYISALCDGETIPAEVAEHIDGCDSCQQRLNEYLGLGVELRRLGNADISKALTPPLPRAPRKLSAVLWRKTCQNIRMPRLAVMSLVGAIVLLACGWARQTVRAGTRGSVLLLQFPTGMGTSNFCALSSSDKKLDSCAGEIETNSGVLLWGLQLLSKNGESAVLGVRAKVEPAHAGISTSQVTEVSQQQYVLDSSQTLAVDVSGFGTMRLSGQWIDHVPSIAAGSVQENGDLDPATGELRLFSPMMLRGDRMVGDLDGASASINAPGQVIDLYFKGEGRFDLSLFPLPGAVEGQVHFNRITFSRGSDSWLLISGAPVTRAGKVWISFNPYPRTSKPDSGSYLEVTQADRSHKS